jgi:hypothetical protein
VKHADAATFARLEDVLVALRSQPELKEVRHGAFYRRGRAFVHFHDDPSGLFADVRLDPAGDFVRVEVTSIPQRRRFLTEVRRALRTSRD